jgi:sigma-E factor negative regulatory protein RseB
MRSLSRWLSLVTLVSWLMPPAAAAAQGHVGVDPRDEWSWLARIHRAASERNYQGVMVFSSGGTMTSSRVWHYAVGGQTYEHVEVLDGRQERIVRHNDIVQTLWPQKHLAVVERRETLSDWSTTPQEVEPHALRVYMLRAEGNDRVAGREAAVLTLTPRDRLRYAQRLWADKATGLLLRADVIDIGEPGGPAPEVLESTAFSEVQIGVKPQPASVLAAMVDPGRSSGYRVLQPRQHLTTLDREGWTLADPVPGYRLGGCIRRSMETPGDDTQVLQAVFSDGLTHVSVFVEPYRPDRHRGQTQGQRGATGTLIVRRGDYWVTTVGDVPLTTLRLFSAALARKRP